MFTDQIKDYIYFTFSFLIFHQSIPKNVLNGFSIIVVKVSWLTYFVSKSRIIKQHS